jgi:general secretion pathway protein H
MRISRAGSDARRVAPAGFTLLEILVTLAIIAIVSALVAPAIAGRLLEPPPQRSARLLKGMLEEARARAATRGVAVPVLWSPETRRFTLGGGAAERALEIPADVEVTTQDLVNAGSDAAGIETLQGVVFFPLGGSTGGSVVLRSGSSVISLRLQRLSGNVELGTTG